MSNIMKKAEQKLGDHPNVSSDPNINPTSGIDVGSRKGNDPNKSWVQNKIDAGQGADSKLVKMADANRQNSTKPDSITSPDTLSPAEVSRVLEAGENLREGRRGHSCFKQGSYHSKQGLPVFSHHNRHIP